MATPTDKVQGMCVYLELKKVGATSVGVNQLFVFPEGHTDDGEEVQAHMLFRVLTDTKPSGNWTHTPIPQVMPAPSGADGLPDDELEGYADFRMKFVVKLFDEAVTKGWSLVGPPLVLEMSQKDFADVRGKEVPQKLLFRMDRTRLALGYPAAYI